MLLVAYPYPISIYRVRNPNKVKIILMLKVPANMHPKWMDEMRTSLNEKKNHNKKKTTWSRAGLGTSCHDIGRQSQVNQKCSSFRHILGRRVVVGTRMSIDRRSLIVCVYSFHSHMHRDGFVSNRSTSAHANTCLQLRITRSAATETPRIHTHIQRPCTHKF